MKDLRLVIGNKNYSSWSMCPWLLLKMFDVDFEEIQIALYQDNTAEKLGPYSPSLKVPVLLHREITVWDSLSICEYISEQFLNGSAWPASPKRRASARSASAEIHAEFPTSKKSGRSIVRLHTSLSRRPNFLMKLLELMRSGVAADASLERTAITSMAASRLRTVCTPR